MHTSLRSCTSPIADVSGTKQKVLSWLRRFSTFCFLDNQQYSTTPHTMECLAAAGIQEMVTGDDTEAADVFFRNDQWLFGHLSYELKNPLHQLPAAIKENKIGFPPFSFFVPQVVIELKEGLLIVHAEKPEETHAQIVSQPGNTAPSPFAIDISSVLTKEKYIEKIKGLQTHILRGDCYEVNFCHEFFAERARLDPFAVFQKLMAVSPNPFSAFYRLHDKYLLCASPERFLAKQGSILVSQPIKGTIQRNLADKEADEELKRTLQQSQKERAENVMVVDLVRNDLTKVCKPGTVKVNELFGVYSFPQVHQMISTISGEVKDGVSFSQILRATFPMGSMTGAPKLRVMNLIDDYELSARGIFSGCVGYKTPDGDFDFNVVIRSIMYNETRRYLSYQVGSGITFYSDAEKEWEECLLKAAAIRTVLSA
jgi:para-aminobenzoate synthetase component I